MHAMILAAGRGKRMRPLTDHTPKPLLTVDGVPLIVHHLRRLKAANITEIVINHAWLGEQIEATLGDGTPWGVHIHYSAEGQQGLETAGGIARALPLLGTDPFLVINGDILTDINLHTAHTIAQHIHHTSQLAHLWLVANPSHHPTGDFVLNPDGSVSAQGTPQYTFSGVGIYSPALFDAVDPNTPAKLAPILRHAMAQQRVQGTLHTGLWLDVGTPERLKRASNRMSASHTQGTPP